MSGIKGINTSARATMEMSWDPRTRLAVLDFTADTELTGEHGSFIVDSLKGWIGAGDEIFGFLVDAGPVRSTNTDYRTATGRFFADHRTSARIALYNLGPLIRVVAEMFRVGVRLQLAAFADEAAARAWLRANGVAA